MTKTPDEIKKGLGEAIAEASWVVDDGDMHDLRDACDKARTNMADALVLIQQLETQNAELLKKVEELSKANEVLMIQRDDISDACHRVCEERDAAVKDMIIASVNSCDACKYNELVIEEAPCKSCTHIFKGRESKFEWRGVQKEE